MRLNSDFAYLNSSVSDTLDVQQGESGMVRLLGFDPRLAH
jgi:hypothetical protein